MRPLSQHTFTLRRILGILGMCALAVILVSYILYQSRNFILGPSIELFGEAFSIHESKTVLVEGRAKNIVKLLLNGREIYTTPDGSFAHMVVLEHGYNIVTLYAEDRFGRQTTLMHEYVAVPTHTEESEV